MTTTNGPITGTEMVLTQRQQKLLEVRDELAPGNRPSAIVPRTFLEVQQMCQSLAAAQIVPKAFRERPQDMLIVVMSGLEVGIPPMAALRLYTTWDGVPRLMAEGIRAVILSHPECEYFEVKTCSEKEATWITKKRGRPEKSATWTIERAVKAGLTAKDIWQKYAEDMLNARASMQLGRIIWPDVVAGMVSREEAMDGDFIDAHATEAKPSGFVQVPVTGAAPFASAPAIRDNAPANDKPADPPRRQRRADPMPPAATTPTGIAPPPDSSLAVAIKAGREAEQARVVGGVADASPPTTRDSWGQPIAPADAPLPPTGASSSAAPSESGASASSSSPESGATTADAGAEDDGFGGVEPEPEPDLLNVKLKDFYAWVNNCKTRKELQDGLGQWRAWSALQAKPVSEGGKADPDFLKASPGVPEGKGTIAMQTAYAKRKTEVPA